MPVPEGNVTIHFDIPLEVRETINAMKEKDPKYSRRYIFMCGYEAIMGLSEDDPEVLRRELENTRDEKAVIEMKERQLIEKLEAVKAREEAEKEESIKEESETDKVVSEILRLSSEIIYFKNTQMLRYIKGLLSYKESSEIEEFFDRRELPTEDEIRAFLGN